MHNNKNATDSEMVSKTIASSKVNCHPLHCLTQIKLMHNKINEPTWPTTQRAMKNDRPNDNDNYGKRTLTKTVIIMTISASNHQYCAK